MGPSSLPPLTLPPTPWRAAERHLIFRLGGLALLALLGESPEPRRG